MLYNAGSEVEPFWKAIQADPKDVLPRLVFADWLEEKQTNRHNRSLAFALRWSAERKRYPLVSPAGRVATWLSEPPYRSRVRYGPYRPCVLPVMVFDQLYPRQGFQRQHKANSVSGAFERLALALSNIRHVIGWNI